MRYGPARGAGWQPLFGCTQDKLYPFLICLTERSRSVSDKFKRFIEEPDPN